MQVNTAAVRHAPAVLGFCFYVLTVRLQELMLFRCKAASTADCVLLPTEKHCFPASSGAPESKVHVSAGTGASLGNVSVPVGVALVLDDEDEVKAGEDGRLQLNILPSRLQVIIPASCILLSAQRHSGFLMYPMKSPHC